MYPAHPELAAFIQSLPKTETHLHLEGSCPLELVDRHAPDLFGKIPYMWDDGFRYDSFTQFTELFGQIAQAVFTTPRAYHDCAKAVFRNCVEQNCHYVECSFHVGVLTQPGMHGPEVIDAILTAAPPGLEVRVFVGMRHNSFDALTAPIIEDCIHWPQLTGIDLHGPEDLPLEAWTPRIWHRARDEGKFLKAHAGEFMPAAFVERCIRELGVQRIEHGVRAIEDPTVIDLLKARNIALDVCPTSNLKLQVEGIPTMRHHPIRQLFDEGVTCTLSTDDTLMFGNTLNEEYVALALDLHFTAQELAQLALNGFDLALWDSPEKEAHQQALKTIIERG